jgi:hypothetical protein
MPKKSTPARGGAQRNKPRVQKSFELVRETPDQISAEQEAGMEDTTSPEEEAAGLEAAPVSVSTMVAPEPKKAASSAPKRVQAAVKNESPETRVLAETPAPDVERTSAAPKGSAAARLAARRQSAQKAQQRNAATLITSEHYVYVRRDLIFIAILALIMFSIIIILHFVPGIGS